MFGLEHLLKVIDPVPVGIDHQGCLRARHRRSACRACTEGCPHEAITYENGRIAVDSGRCTRCGICAGACPTAAMTIRGIDSTKVAASSQIHCSQVAGAGYELPCLGWLNVDHLIGLGLRHNQVTLLCGDCNDCVWQTGGRMAADAVALATETLGLLDKSIAIHLVREAEAPPASDRVVSRRELFSFWATESTQVAKQLLPEREVNPAKLSARVPVSRTSWLKQVNPQDISELGILPTGPWKARTVSDKCTGCGICVAFCPTGALTQQTEGVQWSLSNQPAACVGCGTCEALCPVKAIGEEPLPLAVMVAGSTPELISLSVCRCNSCRKEFKGKADEEKCPQCRAQFAMLKL